LAFPAPGQRTRGPLDGRKPVSSFTHMAKTSGKEAVKPKSLKEQKKELEARLFGEKSNAKKKELQGLVKKIDLALKLETDARLAQEKSRKQQVFRQLIPVGVDPKTVQCVNFLNGTCDKGEGCQFAHELKRASKPAEEETEAPRPRALCRFLLDAINGGEYSAAWVCPFPSCRDIHRLVDLGANADVEVSLEEYIELQRQTIDETAVTPVTEEVFKEWRARKDREEELHAKRVAALGADVRGVDLFKQRPELFEDDEDAEADVDYKARDYEGFDDDDQAAAEN